MTGSKYYDKLTIIGPPAIRHWPARDKLLNGVLLAGPCWPNIECWLGSFVIFQGIQSSIAKKPFIFVIFQGGGGGGGLDPLSPRLSLRMYSILI